MKPKIYCGAFTKKFIVPAMAMIITLPVNASAAEKTGSIYEACRSMADKIEAQSEFDWRSSKKSWKTFSDPIKNAEFTVLAPTGMTRKELEELWPTFLDWAVLEILKAQQLNLPPSQLRVRLYMNCVAEYS